MSVRVYGAIDFGLLAQVVWVSVAATLVVSIAFALVVRESGRSLEARRSGKDGAAMVHAGLALLFFAAFVVIVVVGVITMLNKD